MIVKKKKNCIFFVIKYKNHNIKGIRYFNGSTLFVYFFKYSSKFHEDQNPPACIFYKRSTFLIAEERSVMQVGKSFPEL